MNKKRTTIWLSQDVMDRLDEMTKTDDSKSRSEFIERAIMFYDGYNRSTLENQYLPVAISSAVQGTVKSSEDRISKLLYKNTVELSMVMNVLSAIADVDNDTLKISKRFLIHNSYIKTVVIVCRLERNDLHVKTG